MRVPTRPRSFGLRFNLTPLIDIVFLLVIFFLAASHFARSETAEAVELPEATQSEREDSARRRLVVTVTAEGTYRIGGRAIDLAGLERRIAGDGRKLEEVRIRADRSVPYRLIEPILLSCAESGVHSVKFAVVRR